jgi:cytochrome c nitrite reductase small subunit
VKGRDVSWLILAIVVGIAIGVSGFTFVYARGASYLTDRPEACANCHVMQEQFTGWIRSSHRSAAVCNDCHTPKGIVPKYLNKFSNGLRHSWAFTTGWFHEPIIINVRNHEITEARCRDCHEQITEAINADHESENGFDCIRCHGAVGHP